MAEGRRVVNKQQEESSFLQAVEDRTILDPLSEVTRKERRALLGTSLVTFAISQAGLIPTEISAFGVVVSEMEQVSLLVLAGLVLLYFEIAHIVYSAADLKLRENAQLRGREAIASAAAINKIPELLERMRDSIMRDQEERTDWEALGNLQDQMKLVGSTQVVGRVRILFDVHLPVLVGFIALAFVISALQGYTGATWAVAIVSTAATMVLLFYAVRGRHQFGKWLAKQRRRWHQWYYGKLIEKLKDEDLGARKRERLLQSLTRHLESSLKGPW